MELVSPVRSRGTAEGRSVPWVEKYRPKSVLDVCHQEDVVNALRRSLESGSLPHLLFYGPPGTGKTSTILAFCREMFGSMMSSRVLELNASDERGISVIREKVKSFSSQSVSSSNAALPPYKVVILDEADAMTSDAQSALRRILESSTRMTRFCLICNYISRIIAPLTSRCAKFRFESLPSSVMESRLQMIGSSEGLDYSPEIYRSVMEISHGDLRKAIHTLENASVVYSGDVSVPLLEEMGGCVPIARLESLLSCVKSKRLDSIDLEVLSLVSDGYSAIRIASQVLESILNDVSVEDDLKSRAALAFASLDFELTKGSDEYLQLMSALSSVVSVSPATVSVDAA